MVSTQSPAGAVSTHLLIGRPCFQLLPVIWSPGAVQCPKQVAHHGDAQQGRHDGHGHSPVVDAACSSMCLCTSVPHSHRHAAPDSLAWRNATILALCVNAAQGDGLPWMAPMMGGKGTSPNRCMVMICMACPAGRWGMGIAHMLTASAQPPQGRRAQLPAVSVATAAAAAGQCLGRALAAALHSRGCEESAH